MKSAKKCFWFPHHNTQHALEMYLDACSEVVPVKCPGLNYLSCVTTPKLWRTTGDLLWHLLFSRNLVSLWRQPAHKFHKDFQVIWAITQHHGTCLHHTLLVYKDDEGEEGILWGAAGFPAGPHSITTTAGAINIATQREDTWTLI